MTAYPQGATGFNAALRHHVLRHQAARPAAPTARRPAYAMTLDDFDAPPPAPPEPAPAPAPPAPDPLPGLLAEARAAGRAEGREAGRAEAMASIDAAAAVALREAASALALAGEEARNVAQQVADAVARAAFAAVLAALPSLAGRVAEAEVLRFVESLLPSLTAEPGVVLRVAPDLAAPIAAHFAREPRIEVLAEAGLPRGDVKAAWRGGEAERRQQAAQDAVTATFAGFGLA